MTNTKVDLIARLGVGEDAPGRIKSKLETDEQMHEFGGLLEQYNGPLTVMNTADCMDDRPTIALGDGTEELAKLDARVVWQLPGGLVLAATKAAVAADAAYLKNSRNFQNAYEITHDLLTKMGYQDGGHKGCGASKLVEKSVSEPVADEILIPTTQAVLAINSGLPFGLSADNIGLFSGKLKANKQHKLQDGFYSAWSHEWHEDFLSQRVPENFSILQTADDAVHGHYADAVELISADNTGVGFAKNAFYRATGKMAFGVTEEPMVKLSQDLGGTDEERARILVAFADDAPNVCNHLLAKEMPVFAISA